MLEASPDSAERTGLSLLLACALQVLPRARWWWAAEDPKGALVRARGRTGTLDAAAAGACLVETHVVADRAMLVVCVLRAGMWTEKPAGLCAWVVKRGEL